MVDTQSEAPLARLCSRQGCKREALYTLTYVYADSTAVVGPLSVHNEPHAYDLCEIHAQRMTAPRGWEILRVELPGADQDIQAASHASVTPLAPVHQANPLRRPDPVVAEARPQWAESARQESAPVSKSHEPFRQESESAGQESEPSAGESGPSALESYDGEDSLAQEIFFHQDSEREMIRDSTPAQPKGMRIPHLRRRPRSDS